MILQLDIDNECDDCCCFCGQCTFLLTSLITMLMGYGLFGLTCSVCAGFISQQPALKLVICHIVINILITWCAVLCCDVLCYAC